MLKSTVLFLVGLSIAGAAAGHVFMYSFPSSASDLSIGPVTDLTPAGNAATATGFASTGLSTDIPPAMPPAGRSVDCGTAADARRIRTDGAQLLSNTAVLAAGGFYFDVWFKTGNIGSATRLVILDYAGTEKLFVTGATLTMILSNSMFSYSTTVSANTWHHAQFLFDNVAGNATSMTGTGKLFLDGTLVASSAGAKSNLGDSLNQRIAICSHAAGTIEYFDGLVYDPIVGLRNTLPVELLSFSVE